MERGIGQGEWERRNMGKQRERGINGVNHASRSLPFSDSPHA